MSNSVPTQTDRLLRLTDLVGRKATPAKPAIQGMLSVSASWVWSMVRAGKFPKPIKLGERTTVWKQSDIMNYIAAHQPQAA